MLSVGTSGMPDSRSLRCVLSVKAHIGRERSSLLLEVQTDNVILQVANEISEILFTNASFNWFSKGYLPRILRFGDYVIKRRRWDKIIDNDSRVKYKIYFAGKLCSFATIRLLYCNAYGVRYEYRLYRFSCNDNNLHVLRELKGQLISECERIKAHREHIDQKRAKYKASLL